MGSEAAGHIAVRKQNMNAGAYLVLSPSLFVQSETQAHEMVQPTFGMALPSLTSPETPSETHPVVSPK